MDDLVSGAAIRFLFAWTGGLASAMAFGGVMVLYLSQRTRILRLAALFALSLALLGSGFFLDSLPPRALEGTVLLSILASLLRVAGVVLNIAVTPFFVASLCSAPVSPGLGRILRFWTGASVTLSLLYPFLPRGEYAALAVSVQLILTVSGSLIWTAFRLRHIAFLPLQKALRVFIYGTVAFMSLVVLDMAVTIVPIAFLSPVDNLSVPLYLLLLSISLFFFVKAHFAAGPFVEDGTVTPECKNRFNLTVREAEIVARLLGGGSNQEVADSLFISRKTLENHLLNVYRKMGVKSRLQLLQTLQDWKRQV